MDAKQKAHAIKILEYNDYPRYNAVLNRVTRGELNIKKMIQEIQDETVVGAEFLQEVLDAEQNAED